MDQVEDPTILLTNDDGITSEGLTALQQGLADIGEVIVAAPVADQSHAGRALSWEVPVEEHEFGYAIDGTPTDCIIVGIEALDIDPDIVVAGINKGANIGGYVLGRSGTVSAAVEAAFFDIPAIAASLYVPPSAGDIDTVSFDEPAYADAVDAIQYLVDRSLGAGVFETADYLNVNIPYAETPVTDMRVTYPSRRYEMSARHNGNEAVLVDRIWELIAAGDLDEQAGTDRHAILAGDISVSPLQVPHGSDPDPTLTELATTYPPGEPSSHQ